MILPGGYQQHQLGLNEYKDRHPLALSGGQHQRLAVAVSMICGKQILIFDEHTSGLDLHSMHQVAIENLVEHLEKLGAPHVEGTHYTNLPQIWWENLLQTTYTGNVTASDQTRPPVLEYVSFIQPFFSSIQQVIAYINVILRGDFGRCASGVCGL